MANGKCGRPKKEVTKTNRLWIRLTDAQKEKLMNNAKQQRYSSISSYMIDKLFSRNFSKYQGGLELSDINLIRETNKELNSIGVNLNQIAKKINSFKPDVEESVLHYEVSKVLLFIENIEELQKKIDFIILSESRKLLGNYKKEKSE